MPHVSLPLRDMGTEVEMFIHHRLAPTSSPTLIPMPSHPERFHSSGDLHFLTFSCYHRQPLFSIASRRTLFLESLEHIRRRYRFVVLGYVVMPEHVHLLLSEPQCDNISTVMQALKLSFVRRLSATAVPTSRKIGETWGIPCLDKNDKNETAKSHHFWQARFYDFNIWTEKKRIEKLRYIHRNPVTRGLVASPEQWPWSSFHHYLSGERGPVRINDTDILVMRVRTKSA